MLKSLNLKGVGPAHHMTVEFGERLNVITGDNGLGKSFLLDIAFRAMTRRWPGEVNARLNAGKRALPRPHEEGEISFEFTSRTRSENYTSRYVSADDLRRRSPLVWSELRRQGWLPTDAPEH